jgi:hypothetical protein
MPEVLRREGVPTGTGFALCLDATMIEVERFEFRFCELEAITLRAM